MAEELLGSSHLDPITRRAATTLVEDADTIRGQAEERIAQRASEWPDLPEEVSLAVPGWTAAELQVEFETLYPRANGVDDPKKLVPLLQKAIRRVPNAAFERRFESDPEVAAEYLFDRTDALICAATRWGGVECRLQAMLAKVALGRLRDARFVTPMLESTEFARTLKIALHSKTCTAPRPRGAQS